MALNQHATPIILCGKTEAIGKGVVEGLKPDYEVVQFIQGPEAAISEIPTILQGQIPVAPSSTLGTSNVSVRPKAIVLGGAFAEHLENVKTQVDKQFVQSGGSKIAWCVHDASKPHPPIGPEYAKAMLDRVRELLARLKSEGKLDEPKDEIYYY